MMVDDLLDFGLPEEGLEIFGDRGIEELYPPQVDGVRSGVLDGRNLVLAVPTASGKTLVSELGILKSVFSGGRTLYIVPLKALAYEKFELFKEYERYGFNVGVATGDYDRSADYLSDMDVVVTTSEKADSMLRLGTDWIGDVDVVVCDEVHLVDSDRRGPTLEVTLAKLMMMNPGAQVIALSATISNAREIANWLDAGLVKSDWRPIELKEGVVFDDFIDFPFDGGKEVCSDEDDVATSLVRDAVLEGGQALVFTSSRRNSRGAAGRIVGSLDDLLSPMEEDRLMELSNDILDVDGVTEEGERLARYVRRGVAFHHAGLRNTHLRRIEKLFSSGDLKAICSTPTLAWGINLPARRVVVRDYKRYDPNYGMKPIPVLDVKQMFGRAGRPGMDPYGEAVLIAKNEVERDQLIDRYVVGDTENITSKLASEPALRSHVLSTIASGFAGSYSELMDFIDRTFFAVQNRPEDIQLLVKRVLGFLESEGFIEVDGFGLGSGSGFDATAIGKRVSELYIDPLSASRILERLSGRGMESDIEFLHMVCETPDMDTLYMRKSDYSRVESFLKENPRLKERGEMDDWFLSEVKTSLLLKDWIDEEDDGDICDWYGVSSGDIRRKASTAEWLLHSAAELSKMSMSLYINRLRNLQRRMQYGVKKELSDLVSISGIGRVRARELYKNGYRTKSDLHELIDNQSLVREVDGVGAKTIEKIKRELGGNE
ncbi:Replicative superfamily II helicase BRR2 [Methanonatronarchaeum thermophilum]|uniref:ATP-dependent DNA helicase Hel308 n=1 Tax=Methanonatronarchaeum thermophilum TaxID=1927129 RepID=A0A1Y3GFF0_9EURY|nr:DEAD/DEAH box helicase [Methanonatronarchaeum thermophilum]OUJ19023.1 Replicative superfamily II helicase BRR2 [Methanonatronarchaeum thermophilum]